MRTDADGMATTATEVAVGFPHSATVVDWGDVYACHGVVECDGHTHVVCPQETWTRIKEANTENARGEYRRGE